MESQLHTYFCPLLYTMGYFYHLTYNFIYTSSVKYANSMKIEAMFCSQVYPQCLIIDLATFK